MTDTPSLKFHLTIQAPVAQVYQALSSSASLQSWFADFAEIDAVQGGRFYAWWSAGYYAVGTVKKCQQNKQITLSWLGMDEPEPSKVRFLLKEEDGITHVQIRHTADFLDEPREDTTRQKISAGWRLALENLKSVLETGLDKRIYDQPMLGVFPVGLVDEKMKQELGLSIDSGVRISGVLPGMGADVAGLKSDDVIFSINERELKTFQDFEKAIRGKIAGDVVEVVLYRGSEKLNMPMTLTGRQAPALPATAQILAEEATKVYKAIDAELDAIFEGVSEEQADARPEPDEWSAKETLAHLIYTERWLHIAISCFLDNQHTGGFYNDLGQLAAMADAYTLEALIAEIKLCEVITVATVAALPESFMADKRRLLQLVQNVNEHGFALHTRSHFPQIEAALEAARISTRE